MLQSQRNKNENTQSQEEGRDDSDSDSHKQQKQKHKQQKHKQQKHKHKQQKHLLFRLIESKQWEAVRDRLNDIAMAARTSAVLRNRNINMNRSKALVVEESKSSVYQHEHQNQNEHECDSDSDSDLGLTCLGVAICYSAPLDIIGRLIEDDPTLPMKHDDYGLTVLHLGCLNGARANVIQFLLMRYAHLARELDYDGRCPLHHAVEFACCSISEKTNVPSSSGGDRVGDCVGDGLGTAGAGSPGAGAGVGCAPMNMNANINMNANTITNCSSGATSPLSLSSSSSLNPSYIYMDVLRILCAAEPEMVHTVDRFGISPLDMVQDEKASVPVGSPEHAQFEAIYRILQGVSVHVYRRRKRHWEREWAMYHRQDALLLVGATPTSAPVPVPVPATITPLVATTAAPTKFMPPQQLALALAPLTTSTMTTTNTMTMTMTTLSGGKRRGLWSHIINDKLKLQTTPASKMTGAISADRHRHAMLNHFLS